MERKDFTRKRNTSRPWRLTAGGVGVYALCAGLHTATHERSTHERKGWMGLPVGRR
jgi:hypothetical protein